MMSIRNCGSRPTGPACLAQIGSSSSPMNSESPGELTNLQYWWVFSVSLLAPLASIWIESAWVFSRETRPYQALIFHFDNPMLWIISGFEFSSGPPGEQSYRRTLKRRNWVATDGAPRSIVTPTN